MARKKLTDEEKKKLDNSKVPSVTLKGAVRAASNGDFEEADRRWNLVKDYQEKQKKK